MAGKGLEALFLHQLKDTYFAESAILKALPKLIEVASAPELKTALGVHIDETRVQIERLDKVFALLGQEPEGVECKAIQGIISEGEEIATEFAGDEALDAGVIAAAQAVEHYEITRYGTMLSWAEQLGMDDAADLLKETLVEEENMDDILSELAEDIVNPAAQG